LPSDYFRVDALTSLIPHLPVTRRAAMLEEALQLARTLPTGNNRTHALGALAALLSPNQQREVVLEALNAARLIEDEYGRFLTFIRIAKQSESRVSSAAISRATALIRSGIGYVIHRAEALGALAPFLATSEQRQALTEALQLAARSPNPQFRISAIINLIPQLPQDLQQVAVRHVLDAHLEDPFRALHLVAFVKAVPDTLKQAMTIISIRELKGSSLQFREEALLELAKFTQGEQQRDLLSEAQRWIDGLDKAGERVRQYIKFQLLMHDLNESDKLIPKIEHEISQIYDGNEKATVLVDLVAVLPERLHSRFVLRAYDAAKAHTSSVKKAHYLAKLAPYLHEPERTQAAAQSFEAARSIDQEIARLQALRTVTPLLDGAQRLKAVELLLDSCARVQRSHTVGVLGDLPSIVAREDHASVLLLAMAALDEMAEWFP
jgi:hypothetical protein